MACRACLGPRSPLRPFEGIPMCRSLLPFAAPFAFLAASPALAMDETFDTQGPGIHMSTVADGLDHPWALAFLPDGGMLVTERPGALRHVSASGEVSEPIAGVPEVDARGQGGLL